MSIELFFREFLNEEIEKKIKNYKLIRLVGCSQFNPKRQRFAKVWSKLPLRLTTTAGPLIRKEMP
jgi:hypothetical protein